MPNRLPLSQLTSLRLSHKQVRDKRSADRIKAVYLWGAGDSFPEIARVLLLDETTLKRYVRRFREAGIEGLLECRYTGGSVHLTSNQIQELTNYLITHTLRTAQAVATHINKRYQKHYSLAGVTKLLHRLGFTYKKPKVIPGKMDPQRQLDFIDEYQKIKQSLGTHDTIHFLDATHPTHNTAASYGWIKRGKSGDKYLPTNTGRERLNLNGALNLKTKQALVMPQSTINAQAVIKLLNKLLKQYPKGKIHLILDNARYYLARIIKQWRRHHTRVRFHFLPPYSPNLNLIERLWLFFHRKVTANRYFPSFKQFKQAALYFFRHLDRYQAELASLLTDNFQTYSVTDG